VILDVTYQAGVSAFCNTDTLRQRLQKPLDFPIGEMPPLAFLEVA
jgi:hypothetical protein